MEIIQQQLHPLTGKIISRIKRFDFFLKQHIVLLLSRIKTIGYSATMEEYDLRKLGVFNQLNFFQLLTGIFIPLSCLFNNKQLPAGGWLVVCLPVLVSTVVLFLNKLMKYEVALISYFILYPFVTCIIYMYGINL